MLNFVYKFKRYAALENVFPLFSVALVVSWRKYAGSSPYSSYDD